MQPNQDVWGPFGPQGILIYYRNMVSPLIFFSFYVDIGTCWGPYETIIGTQT